jgi:hypothetical protein
MAEKVNITFQPAKKKFQKDNFFSFLVRMLNDHFKSETEPPDLRPSSNVDFPVPWITGPATDCGHIISPMGLYHIQRQRLL